MKKTFNVRKENFIVDKRLYFCSIEEIFEVIKSISNGFHIVMLVGHNPSWTELVNTLGNVYIENLPTTGFV